MATNFRTYRPFLGVFPKVQYDINKSQYQNFETVTNILFRLSILKDVLNNTSSYYVYDVEGDDTPEIVAEKVYGDAGAGWIVIYANQIVDPQFDWVLTDRAFKKYIIGKYGSVENAQTTVHHYERVVETTVNGYTSSFTYVIDETKLTENDLDVPYDTFSEYLTDLTVDIDSYTIDSSSFTVDTVDIAATGSDIGAINSQVNKSFNTYTVDGQVIDEVIYVQEVTNYDYESKLNDSRRQIKVIQNIYYNDIIAEFNNLTKNVPSYIRTVS